MKQNPYQTEIQSYFMHTIITLLLFLLVILTIIRYSWLIKMNNVTIPPERGFPFMLVAESKWGYKWIKWVTKIEVSNNYYIQRLLGK